MRSATASEQIGWQRAERHEFMVTCGQRLSEGWAERKLFRLGGRDGKCTVAVRIGGAAPKGLMGMRAFAGEALDHALTAARAGRGGGGLVRLVRPV